MIKVVKFRDLTDEEATKICDYIYNKYKSCLNCPLKIGDLDNICFINLDLDRAIEVEYDESK